MRADRRGILLVDHGSRSAAANENLERIAERVRALLEAGPSLERPLVGIAHMELAPPSIPSALRALIEAGASEIVVVPYFLAAGRHSTEDIPRLVADAMRSHPTIRHRVALPLGVDDLLARLVLTRASE